MKSPIPVLRSFDETKAKDFYIAFVGFQLDWEHRFGDDAPLYMQVSRGDCILHLSEHHGDSSPGARIRITTPDLDDYVAQLRSINHPHCRPGEPEMQPWGLREIEITDPFSNRLTLCSE